MTDYELPPRGNGNRVLPLTDPAERTLAEHVGAVVLMAAQVEASLASLVDLVRGGASKPSLRAWGESGRELRRQLKSIEDAAPETLGFAERYEQLNELRNQVVHSIRPKVSASEARGDVTLRPLVKHKGVLREQVIGVPELIDLWYALQELNYDSFQVFMDHASRSVYAPKWIADEASAPDDRNLD